MVILAFPSIQPGKAAGFFGCFFQTQEKAGKHEGFIKWRKKRWRCSSTTQPRQPPKTWLKCLANSPALMLPTPHLLRWGSSASMGYATGRRPDANAFKRGAEKEARRWVVALAHSGFSRFRKLLVRG